MKKMLEAATFILLLPLLILIFIFFLIYTPIDYLKYRKTAYYKDTKEKYSWLCASSHYISLYEAVNKTNLPIRFHRNNSINMSSYGYFLYKDWLIVPGYESISYDKENGKWTVEVEDEHIAIEDAARKDICECNEFLENQVAKKALILVDNDEYSQDDFPNSDELTFIPAPNKKEFAEILQNFIEQNI